MKTRISPHCRPVAMGTGLVALDITQGADESAADPLRMWTGGTCGNVLAALQFLGWQARPIARLGDDVAGRIVVEDLSSLGVDTTLVELAEGGRTPAILHRIRERAGERTHGYGWACPTCGERYASFRPVLSVRASEVAATLEQSQVFFFDRVSRSALDLARMAAEAGAVVVFEPSASVDPGAFDEAVRWADIVKYADDRRDKIEGGLKAMARGPKPFLEVETRGAEGLRFRTATDRTWTSKPALAVPELRDAAGSGDWLTAGLVSSLARDGRKGLRQSTAGSVESALVFGQALASWNCAFEGARGGMYVQPHGPIGPRVLQILEEQRVGQSSGKRAKVRRRLASAVCDSCSAAGSRARVIARPQLA